MSIPAPNSGTEQFASPRDRALINQKSDFDGLRKILGILPRKRRVGVAVLTLVMIVSAALEALLLVAVMQAVNYLQHATLGDSPLRGLVPVSVAGDERVLGIFVATLLVGAVVLTTIARIGLLRSTAMLAYGSGRDVAMQLLERNLKAQVPYVSVSGSATLIGSVNRVQILSHTVFLPVLRAIASGFLVLAIMFTLFASDPLTAALAFAVIGATYLFTTLILRKRLHQNGRIISKTQERRISVLRESIGSIREIRLYENREVFEHEFETLETAFRTAQANNLYYAQSPRYGIEAVGLILFGGLIFASTYDGGILPVSLPAIGALAIGAQRMLPLMQQMFNGWAQYSGNIGVVADIVESLDLLAAHADIELGQEDKAPLAWSRLVFDDVSYQHKEAADPAIVSASFILNRGDKILVSGQTGSGKSTLIDLITTFRKPTSGRIMLDGEEMSERLTGIWRSQIALVPQSTFFLDGTVRDNILFGKSPGPEDDEMIRQVLHLTDLEETVADLPDGLDNKIGEDGTRLSGGQRQRLSVARALFRNRPILVLDEATSALDAATEERILERLEREKPELTVIHISHRAHATTRANGELKVADRVARLSALEQVV